MKGFSHKLPPVRKGLLTMSALLIPRIFHTTWHGNEPLPEEFAFYRQTWLEKNPGWTILEWNEGNMIPLINQAAYIAAEIPALKSDIARPELIYRIGGIYIDCDFECLKSIEPLVKGLEAFGAGEAPGIITNAFIGGAPGHPAYKLLIEGIPDSIDQNHEFPINHQTGPVYYTRMLGGRSDFAVFSHELFYPYSFNEKHRKGEEFPKAYAVHHWAGSWLS